MIIRITVLLLTLFTIWLTFDVHALKRRLDSHQESLKHLIKAVEAINELLGRGRKP